MKKFLTYSVVAATMAWSMGISAVLPAAAATAYVPTDGDIVKVAAANRPGVYYIMGGKKYLFVNRVTYTTWASAIGDTADSFKGLKGITQAEFDALDLGGNITARAGASLIKFDNSDLVYAVAPGAKLCKLADTAAKTALYGAATPILIQSAFETGYTKDASCALTATSKYPDGTLIKSGTAYSYVEGGLLRAVGADAFSANGFKESWAVSVANTSAYTAGSAISGKFVSVISGASTAPIVNTGSVTVSLSSDTPAAGTLVATQASADLAHIVFSGTGTVSGLKLTKIGVSGDDTLSNIYLYDGATRLTDAGTFSSGVVSFSNGSGLFTVSGTKVITVKADVKASTGGLSVGVSVNAAADVTGVTVGGSFPVKGNVMSIASTPSDMVTATIGSATNVGTTVTAGTSNVTLWSNSLTTNQRTTLLKGLTLNQIGSMSADSIANINMFVDGVQVGSGAINTNGILVFDLSASPVSIKNGVHTIDVRGDVVKGSSRTFKFSLRSQADVVVYDSTYGVNLAAAGTFPSEANSGSATTISAGTLSVTTDPSFNTTQIISNATGQTLGKWTMKAYGEDLKVMNLYASTTYTGSLTSGDKISNFAIFVNGVQVGSSQTYTLASSGYAQFGSTNLFTIPAGTTVTVEVRGDLSLSSPATVTGLGSAIKIAANQVQGMTSFATTAVGTDATYASLNTLTVASGALTLAANAALANSTTSPNVVGAKVGSFVITNSNADTVRVTNVKIGLANSTLGYATNTSDLYISETPSNKVSPQSSNNFAVDFSLAPSATKVIDVYMTIGNVTGNDLNKGIITTMDMTARTSAQSDAYASGAKTGQTTIVAVGTLSSVTKTNDSMSSQYVLGGTSNTNLMMLNFKTANSSVIIDELGFQFRGTAVGASSVPVTSVTVNGVTASVSDATATTTLTGLNLTVPAGYAGLDVPVIASYNNVGYGALSSNILVSSSLAYIKYRGGATTYYSYNNAYSVTSSDMLLVATKPTVALVAPTNALAAGTVRIGRITVNADAKGGLKLKTLNLTLATTSAAFDYTADKLVIKTAAGDILTTTNLAVLNGSTTVSFTNGYTVNAGSQAIMDVYVQTASYSGSTSGASKITMGLGTKSLFTWDDVNGNATNITGAYYSNWPIDTVSVQN